jgi:dTDP-glucose 4,6-dehydratase
MTDPRDRQARRRAVVTGGAGFLGSHLCERLLADAFEVLCIDNFLTGSLSNILPLRANPGFRVIDCDITRLTDSPIDIGLVLHFASPASPMDYQRFPTETLKAGSLGTLQALEIARLNRARFVLASTSEVYGNPLEHPQRESYWGNVNPIGPRSAYDEAKRFAEALTVAYKESYGVNTAIARIFNTYGPRMRPADGRVIPTFITQALRGEPITVTGDGSQTRSVCYVADTVDCILKLACSEHPGPVNIGSQEEMTVLDLATYVREITGAHSPIRFIGRPVDDPDVRRPDTTLARKALGWEPSTSLHDGLEKTVPWFAQRLAA